MNILIAGGSGFVGSKLAERFLKEGHNVSIVDIVEPSIKLRPRSRVSFYRTNIADCDLEEVFKDKTFDMVINATVLSSDNEASHLMIITGNINLVHLTIKYKVNRFIYLSNIEVDSLESSLVEIPKDAKIPSKYFTISKKMSEAYCMEAFQNTPVRKMILRLPMVFGHGMKLGFENYYFTKFIETILEDNKIEELMLPKEFEGIYLQECIARIYNLVLEENPSHVFYRIEGNIVTAKEYVDFISSIYPVKKHKIHILDCPKTVFENHLSMKIMESKNSLRDVEKGLQITFEGFIAKRNKRSKMDKKIRVQAPKINKRIFYILSENLFGLIFAYLGCIVSSGYFDGNLPYIMFMGMRYGLLNAVIAVGAALGIKLFILKTDGTFYLYDIIFMLTAYLLTAFISAYVKDRQKGDTKSFKQKLKLQEEKLESMNSRLNQGRKTILNLSEQIKVSDNSFGKVLTATRKLDNFNIEKVLDEMKNVVNEITNFDKVYLYTVNRNEWMLDLYSKSREDIIAAMPRINIYEHESFREVMFKHKLYMNKELESSIPSVIIPIVDRESDRVEAMIIIRDIPFESLNAYTEYILQITGELLSDALTRAYKFEDLQNHSIFDNWKEESNG